ncbi:hypothetical protein [Pseudobacteriovorax antillogorgiicola]|uniref:Uncharacterized protein n=1 Tax=Pseudobacteriovorax antillogorgiicola TaxID=1513793 RepID=A0A1Y6CAX9_9BACT|nr:hypothetical protein [Pseudobacteriovorax antillogorgiicola]TCS49041.1 hypothetical protein EDD56_11684 [Pseudobacteriovorax antillogorgiicola]SMF52646.1 hypothetical protein SAMN06296036_11670 [Pseudobacteriovorax antillogorgiicola]
MKRVYSIFMASMLASCGPEMINPSESNSEEDLTAGQEFATVSVGVQESSTPLFGLAAATSFDMSLENCVSGLTYASIQDTNPNIDVYKFDQDCVVKLNQFVYGGVTWVPSSGDPFTSWLAGDVATFEDSTDNTNTIRVVVASQLDNPVSGTEQISYTFSEIQAGADETIAKNVVSDSHAITVSGQSAPNFTIAAVSFTGLTATGAGQFGITLNCANAVSGSVAGSDIACDGVPLSDITYKLIQDTYSGTLTMSDASALFPTGESVVTVGTDGLDFGDATATNGGFVTVTLTGPDAMHSNPNMILILEAADTSYQYFNIDVTTLTYTP